ncbi:MarR family transcriptional regulator [Frigoribacterium sp. Leaf164]|jgi:DNA-binding MarR family transcriptional regulator|uniref:MarR family winged helix-turn-helix transcriptional regulator n=1 Tax=Frigoribacterium sp. Leaf164 TaxID=1736282 RepID=UPI0009EBE8BE
MPDRSAPIYDASGYWYSSSNEERGVEVLNALRRYRAAESEMRRRTRTSMKMGETDLAAVRFLLRAQRRSETVSAKELADHLGITSASTSVLINRLVRSGHMERHSHPTDKRGVLLTATGDSNSEVRATMASMHTRMISAAESLTADESAAVVGFLRDMTSAIEIDDHGVDGPAGQGHDATTAAPAAVASHPHVATVRETENA